jgi:Tol biopolymer transport system component
MLLSAEVEQPRSIPDIPEYVGGGDGSPGGERLVYTASDRFDNKLIFLAADGTVQEIRDYRPEWEGRLGWLDSERLIFDAKPSSRITLYIYNPFTDQQVIFSRKIDDRYEYDRELSGWHVWKIVPDPTLTRMAYVRAYYDGTKLEYPPALVLVNVENSETLWELRRSTPGDRHIPVWSPDGSQMAVISDDYQSVKSAFRWEVFTVNREGQGVHWFDMDVQEYSQLHYTLGEKLTWSPDG